jgi:hypothetical protein
MVMRARENVLTPPVTTGNTRGALDDHYHGEIDGMNATNKIESVTFATEAEAKESTKQKIIEGLKLMLERAESGELTGLIAIDLGTDAEGVAICEHMYLGVGECKAALQALQSITTRVVRFTPGIGDLIIAIEKAAASGVIGGCMHGAGESKPS